MLIFQDDRSLSRRTKAGFDELYRLSWVYQARAKPQSVTPET